MLAIISHDQLPTQHKKNFTASSLRLNICLVGLCSVHATITHFLEEEVIGQMSESHGVGVIYSVGSGQQLNSILD